MMKNMVTKKKMMKKKTKKKMKTKKTKNPRRSPRETKSFPVHMQIYIN